MRSHSRSSNVAVVLGVVLALLGACRKATGSGEDPYGRLLAHTDRMLVIVRQGEGDPERALRELAAYEEKNGAEIERGKQALAELMQKDPQKASGVAAAYGMRSSELEGRRAQLAARAKPQ